MNVHYLNGNEHSLSQALKDRRATQVKSAAQAAAAETFRPYAAMQ
jgi:hypothetical protein